MRSSTVSRSRVYRSTGKFAMVLRIVATLEDKHLYLALANERLPSHSQVDFRFDVQPAESTVYVWRLVDASSLSNGQTSAIQVRASFAGGTYGLAVEFVSNPGDGGPSFGTITPLVSGLSSTDWITLDVAVAKRAATFRVQRDNTSAVTVSAMLDAAAPPFPDTKGTLATGPKSISPFTMYLDNAVAF
jgi:hypothetical protein